MILCNNLNNIINIIYTYNIKSKIINNLLIFQKSIIKNNRDNFFYISLLNQNVNKFHTLYSYYDYKVDDINTLIYGPRS